MKNKQVIQFIVAFAVLALIGVLVFRNQFQAHGSQAESDAAKNNAVSLVKEKFSDLNDQITQLKEEKENLEVANKDLKTSQDMLKSADKALFLNDQKLVIAYPSAYVVREEDVGYGVDSKFYFTTDTEDLHMRVSIETAESVGQYAASYTEDRGELYCIDHGMCDENFDPREIIKGFNNLKSVTTGNGQQETINAEFFAGMNDVYFHSDVDELKIINDQKFAIFNHSFVPSGDVWRSYVTFVGDTKVTISISWDLDRSIENVLHLHDSEADVMVGNIFVKSV